MIWQLRNLSQRARFSLQNPGYALRSLYREMLWADERFLASITGNSTRTIRNLLNEPIRTEDFAACLRRAESVLPQLQIQSADPYAKKVLIQYAALRALRPDIVVETGVANGVSSAYLLLALHKNGRGGLYSIEVGDSSYLPAGKETGWVVPAWLRPRWRLLIGDSRVLLPKILADLGGLDVFIHDSSHTHEHMLWEYRKAYPYLRAGGLLLSDDASWNTAFAEFVNEVGACQARILHGVGVLQKGTDFEQHRPRPGTGPPEGTGERSR